MKKVLLTGAGGQVGKDIQRTCLQNIELIALDRTQLDITDPRALQAVFLKYQLDIVINAAAYTAVDKAESESSLAYTINSEAVAGLATLCKQHDIPMIHISTDYVFSGDATKPYVETDPVSPMSVYGKSKHSGEENLTRIWHKHIILRTSWVFGAHGKNFVKTILKLAKERDSLNIVADQWGCPTSAYDIALAIWMIVEKLDLNPWGIYHFTNSPAVNWYEFTKNILELAEISMPILPIATGDYPTPAKRPAYSVLNCDKFVSTFGVVPRGWREGLEETVMPATTQ